MLIYISVKKHVFHAIFGIERHLSYLIYQRWCGKHVNVFIHLAIHLIFVERVSRGLLIEDLSRVDLIERCREILKRANPLVCNLLLTTSIFALKINLIAAASIEASLVIVCLTTILVCVEGVNLVILGDKRDFLLSLSRIYLPIGVNHLSIGSFLILRRTLEVIIILIIKESHVCASLGILIILLLANFGAENHAFYVHLLIIIIVISACT